MSTIALVTSAQSSIPSTVSTSSISASIAESPTSPTQSTSVSIRGQSLMLLRLFGITDPNATPPVVSGVTGMDNNHSGMSPSNFLTQSDRALLSNMYAYAQQQGADLQHVDAIGVSLGAYRQANDGRMMGSFNSGEFDSAGHQLTVSFNAQDTATSASLLGGKAINSTQLDQGFLRYTLDPGHGALTFFGDLGFLQQMVIKFSDEGSPDLKLDPKFSTYSPVPVNEKAVFAASKEIINAPAVSDYISINGVGHWRTPELEAKYGTGKYITNLNGLAEDTPYNTNQKTLKYSQISNMLNLMSVSNINKN